MVDLCIIAFPIEDEPHNGTLQQSINLGAYASGWEGTAVTEQVSPTRRGKPDCRVYALWRPEERTDNK